MNIGQNTDKSKDEFVKELYYKYLDELSGTVQLRALQARTFEKYVGKDYLEHFDKTWDTNILRGYIFSPHISVDFKNFDYGDPVTLTLERQPYIKSIPQVGVPYGAWFEWKITANHKENMFSVERTITDPTKTKPVQLEKILTQKAIDDSTIENTRVYSEEEMLKLFRKNTLEALSQLSDFSKLNPEPVLKKEPYPGQLAECLKSFYRSSTYPPRK